MVLLKHINKIETFITQMTKNINLHVKMTYCLI